MSNDLHLLIPALFWPDPALPEIYRDLPLPSLEHLLGKCSLSGNDSQGIEGWLCRAFGVSKQQDWPVAPLTLQIDGTKDVKAEHDYWIRADPVHLRLEHDQVLLADSRVFQVSAEEAEAFTGLLNRHFAMHGEEKIVILPLRPDRWYLRATRQLPVSTHSISEAINRGVTELLPFGPHGAFWRGLFNEIQMLLHEHPLNQAREARKEFAINSVWFWGGGVMPESTASAYTHVWSNHALAASLASACGIRHTPLPPSLTAWQQSAGHGRHLIMLDALHGKAQYGDAYGWRESLKGLERDWFAPLRELSRKKCFGRIMVTALGESTSKDFAARSSDLGKFWRRPKPLPTYTG